MVPELPQRPLAHSGAVLTWTRVGGTELRVGASAPARGERCQARPEPPPQSGAYAFEAISAPMIVSTRRGSPDAVPTSSDRACTSSAAVWSAGRRGHPGAKRAGRAIECGSSATPWSGHDRPTPRPRMVPGACSTGTDHQHRPARHTRRDRGTPPQPRFGPESPRRRSDAEAARSVGETRPPGPPSGSFRPGLLRAGGPAPAARRPATRRR